MIKTLLPVALWAALSWLLGAWLGAAAGWGLFSLGLLAMVLISSIQLARIARWVKNLNDPPPPAVGPWDDILAPVYRTLKRYRGNLENLHESLGGVMAAVEALPDGALLLNADLELVWCNQTASNHLDLNTVTDRHHNIINIFRDPVFARYMRQADWPTPILVRTHRGELSRALLIHMTRYGPEEFLLVTRDVTQLERLETMRKDFVANVSHELRTPLTVLSGFLETLRDTPASNLSEEQRERYLGLMHEQAIRMQAIVSDLLTLSALESRPPSSGKPVDMPALIRAALDQARVLSKDRHTIDEDIDPTLRIHGLESELASAISNLISNAVNYTPATGTIRIHWHRKANGKACFSVSDTGIGIAPQDIPRLTERFYRVDRGRSRSNGSTGLGLAITRHVALRHDADLHIDSRVGEGSRFSLAFPAARVVSPDTP